jgi:YD repeat-containing protein
MRWVLRFLVFLSMPRFLSGQACPTPWTLEEVFRLGSVDGPQALNGVNDLEVGRDGRIYVTQFLAPYVSVFDDRGLPVGIIGRGGSGPGEFYLSAVHIGFRGDTLWATDGAALHAFTPDGKEAYQLKWRTRVPQESSAFLPSTPLADGTFLGERQIVMASGKNGFFDAESLPLLRFDRTGAIVDTIGMVRWNQPRFVTLEGGLKADHPLQGMGNPLTPGIESLLPVVVTRDYRAVILIGAIETAPPAPTLRNLGGLLAEPIGTFQLQRIGIDGDTLLNVPIEYTPRPISRTMQEWLRDSFAAQRAGDFAARSIPGSGPSPAVRERRRAEARDAITFPEFLPPVRSIVSGEDGTIWLLRELREDGEDHWEVYDDQGRLQGTVVITGGKSAALPWSPHVRVMRATKAELWGMTIDDLDVPTIHRQRVVRTCG